MISRPYLDALWGRAARVAARRGAVLDELYLEDARRERAWASTHAPPGALVELDRGASVQVAKGGLVAFAAGAGVAFEDVERLVEDASSRLRAPRRSPVHASLGVERLVAALPRSRDVHVTLELTRSRRRFIVRHAERSARSGHETIEQVEVRAEAERRGRRATIEVRAPFREDGRGLAAAVAEAREAARRALTARAAPRGKTTVIVGPGSGAALFHEVVGHPLEADFIASGRSWYGSHLVGKPLATPELTIADDPGLEGSPVRLDRDDEGVRARRVLLLEEGVLTGLLLDRATARFAGTETNGHGRRSSWRAPPRPRMTNTVVLRGKHRAQDLVGSVRRGVYVARLAFGRADFVTGRFSMAASEAFAIEDGKLGAPLANVHLEGDALSLLGSVVAVGNDLACEKGALLCDKEDEVWVGLAQPTVLLHGIRVG